MNKEQTGQLINTLQMINSDLGGIKQELLKIHKTLRRIEKKTASKISPLTFSSFF